MWATPISSERAQSPRAVDHGVQLANQVSAWATPAASDGNGGHYPSEASRQRGGNSSLNRTLQSLGLPLRLNPDFVDWLMGFPPGWTGCAPLETGRFLSWLRAHSSRLRAVLGW